MDKFLEQAKQKYLGKTYGRATIIEILGIEGKQRKCKAQCTCGNIFTTRLDGLYNGSTKSCGCLNNENRRAKFLNNTYGSKYTYNLELFTKLTEISSYILGYIYTDGCLTKGGATCSITSCDKDVLDKMSTYVCGEIKVQRYKPNCLNCSEHFRFSMTNKTLYNQFLSWGLYPNKSITLVPHPELVNNRDFWRGCIDGDGAAYLNKGNVHLDFCGSIEMVKAFKLYCAAFVKTNNTIGVNSKSGNNFAIRFSGNTAKILIKHFYEGSNIYMDRKYKMLEFCENIDYTRQQRKTLHQYTLDGEMVQAWDSLTKAANALSIKYQNIQGATEKPEYTAGGYRWKYIYDENSDLIKSNTLIYEPL